MGFFILRILRYRQDIGDSYHGLHESALHREMPTNANTASVLHLYGPNTDGGAHLHIFTKKPFGMIRLRTYPPPIRKFVEYTNNFKRTITVSKN